LFQYGANENFVSIPRANFGLVDFTTLRNLSIMCQEIRLNIQKVKEIIRGLDWDITFEGQEVDVAGITYQATPDIERIKHFWEKPDGVHEFDAFVTMLLEEVLVTDALTLYPNYGMGSLEDFTLEIVDGTTIKPLIDFHGRTPRPPAPAYTQVLYGSPRSHYTSERLIYLPRNPKVHSLYGESPIEWVLQMIVQAIKHGAGTTNYFTEGNIPGAFAGLPAEWTVNQIQEFTEWFNAAVQGDEARQWKLMFIPHSGSSLPVVPFQAPSSHEDTSINEWLMTIACWAFGNDPSEFGLTRGAGLGGAGYMEAGENAQYRGSIASNTQFIKSIIDRINRDCLQAPWAKFKWVGLEPPEDSMNTAQVHGQYLQQQIYTPAYVQDKLGIPEKYRPKQQMGMGIPGMPGATNPAQAAQGKRALVPPVPHPGYAPNVKTPAIPAPDVFYRRQEQERMERAISDEMGKWEQKTLRGLKKKWEYSDWTSSVIPAPALNNLNKLLHRCRDEGQVRRAFITFRQQAINHLAKAAEPNPIAKTAARNKRGTGAPLTDDMKPNPYDSLILPVQQEFEDALAEHFADLQKRLRQFTQENL
jgi:hypothetical protein